MVINYTVACIYFLPTLLYFKLTQLLFLNTFLFFISFFVFTVVHTGILKHLYSPKITDIWIKHQLNIIFWVELQLNNKSQKVQHNCISRLWVVALPLHFYLHQNLNYNLNFFFEKEKQTCTEYLVKLRFIWGFHTAITYIINYRVYLPLFCFFPISSYNFYLFNLCFFQFCCFLLASFSFLLHIAVVVGTEYN